MIRVGLPILGFLATLFLASAVDGDSPGSGAGGQGGSLACGCAPQGVTAHAVSAAGRPVRPQRVAFPASKSDLPPRLNSAAAAPAGRATGVPAAEPGHQRNTVTSSSPPEAAFAQLDPEPRQTTTKPHGVMAPPPASAPLRSSVLSGGPTLLTPIDLPPERDVLPRDDAREPSIASASGGVDAKTLRRALAGTMAGVVAGHTRPSLLIGETGGSTLLGTGLDGLWGIGQQAAVSVLAEGKLPGKRQLQQQALQVVAAAAQQEVAGLVSEATEYGEDRGIRFLRNLELRGGWWPGGRPTLEARTIDSLFQSAALDHTLFLQADVITDFSETTANIGAGYRYQPPDSDWMLGLNAFYDRQFPIGHERMSIGIEASTSDVTLFANRYIALSGWTALNPRLEEKPLSGWDVGIAGQMPKLEDLHLSLSAFRWEQETERDRTGLKLMADYAVSPALQFGMTFAGDDTGNIEAGFRLTWEMGGQLFGGGDLAPTPWTDRRLAFVNRESEIRTETRDVPQDYDVAFLAGEVTAANENAIGFALTGVPLESRYSYRITSSAGGTAVTGSGVVTENPQAISGIDVSPLADGMLTLAIQVVSKEGAAGPEVTTSIAKSTVDLGASVEPVSTSPTNQSPLRYRITFSGAVTGFELADLVVTNGTAANLASDDATIFTVDVTPAGQGEVTLQVPADAAAAAAGGKGNTASNAATVTYDSEAPAGYGVAFLSGPITAAGFQISNATVGASYSFTITSSGGGTPVTGSGTVDSVTQQVTGLDLSGLADGTLTLSVTLADALGNAGAAATASMTKEASPLAIVSITAPAPGYFDDL